MKKNKALYMWSAITAVVVAAAVLDYQWDQRTQAQKSESDRLLRVEASQVKELELTLENPASVTKDSVPVMTNRVQLAKLPEGWMLKSPVEELADQDAVKSLVEWLANERASQVKAPEPVDWATFGLDKPRGSIQIKDDQGRAFLVNVSSRKNFEGDAYLRRNTEEKVFLGNAMWFTQIEKTLNEFRDKRILKVPVAEIRRLQIKTGRELLPFERVEGQWTLSNHVGWKLDQNRVRELLAALTGPLAVEYKREGAVRPEDLKEFSLQPARTSVEVEVAEGLTWTAEISERKEAFYYVRVNDPSMIVAIGAAEGDKLVQLRADDFRDRKAPFELSRDKVKSLEVRKAALNLKAEKGPSEWQVREKAEGSVVTGKQIAELIERLRALEVAEYLKDADVSKNLGQDATQISVKDDSGGTMLDLSFGAVTKVKRPLGGERAVVVAKSSLVADPISIDQDQFEALGLADLLGEKQTSAPTETVDPKSEKR